MALPLQFAQPRLRRVGLSTSQSQSRLLGVRARLRDPSALERRRPLRLQIPVQLSSAVSFAVVAPYDACAVAARWGALPPRRQLTKNPTTPQHHTLHATVQTRGPAEVSAPPPIVGGFLGAQFRLPLQFARACARMSSARAPATRRGRRSFSRKTIGSGEAGRATGGGFGAAGAAPALERRRAARAAASSGRAPALAPVWKSGAGPQRRRRDFVTASPRRAAGAGDTGEAPARAPAPQRQARAASPRAAP